MQSPRTSDVTRRTLLASLSGMAGAAMCGQTLVHANEGADTDERPRQMSKVRKEFERLLPLWQEERKQFGSSSNTYDYWKGPHGKAIVALGPAIIPYLIQQVKAGDFRFNVPLDLITNVEIATERFQSEQARSKLWVEWWEAGRKAPSE